MHSVSFCFATSRDKDENRTILNKATVWARPVTNKVWTAYLETFGCDKFII